MKPGMEFTVWSKGEELIDHSFQRGLLMIVAGILLFLLAQVAFFYFKRHVGRSVPM